ncbi:hypothetical protein COU89_02145 [Candidatus Roizmanbacteria bacterium CG10_big_fil_rev_8_21_14_0_10_45_7]|uniref:DUF4412 domain-containing protein n=1 Tax=Candidatus Roizmanbacteria bacterium CG10_big_fil_rev_8_21_14_0_10_45_7 TaxID=1974854 RepID=A0A2M8KUX8_9BACT|nr:MAG: hypothetical protein COU89_02145 [Candidatus Roizmanbacteria bacterium CG10_big_fil_rev_8_21_14_0_10_45_7]
MSNHKLTHGFAGIIIIIVIGLAALGGYFGYQYIQRSKGILTTLQNKKGAVMDKIKDCIYDKDYCMYMQTGLSALSKSMVGTLTTESKDGTKTTSTWETDGKGNMRITNGDKQTGGMIFLDGVMYIQDPEKNVWYEYASGQGTEQKNNFFDVESLKKQFNETKNTVKVTKKGTEACGTRQCNVYDISGDEEMGGTTTIYIDTKEYLMRKTVTQTEQQGKTTVEFEYKPVTIVKPSPVQPLAMPQISGFNLAVTGAQE